MNIKKKIITGAAGLIGGLALTAAVVLAAPGDPVPPGSITPPGPAGAGCGGIGVAFDGTTIWYTCADETKIRKTNLAAADLGFIDTAEGITPVSVDAIAWDPTEGKIWGGELVDTDGDGGNDTCRIYSIDPATGAATKRFDRTDTGCTFSYFDGLTVDSATDTLYYSPDVQKFIRHLKKDGTAAANDPIDFETLTSGPDRCPSNEPFPDSDPIAGCPNSGLAIGLDGSLFAGTNGAGNIVQLSPVAKTFTSVFASVSGRDEDLECGPVVKGTETILSRDFFFPGRIDVLEAPKGTCQRPEPKVEVACKETVNPNGKTVPPAGSTTLPGSKGGQNEDGFYLLSIVSKFPAGTTLWVTDVFSSGPFGPFSPGDKVKITQAPGATPSIKKIGSSTGQAGAIVAHITLKGDPIINALFGGFAIGSTSCLVPPPPK